MSVDRRLFLSAAAASGLGAAVSYAAPMPGPVSKAAQDAKSGFRYCLNTSTIRGQELGIEKEVDVAAAAGYDGIEPWIPTLRQFVEKGGKLSDLAKRISDAGLTVDSAIGFAQWIVDDETWTCFAKSEELASRLRPSVLIRATVQRLICLSRPNDFEHSRILEIKPASYRSLRSGASRRIFHDWARSCL